MPVSGVSFLWPLGHGVRRRFRGFLCFCFLKATDGRPSRAAAPGQRRGPRQSVATQSSSSPLELVLPQTVGPECQHFPIPRGACHRVPSGPAWSLGGARGPGLASPRPSRSLWVVGSGGPALAPGSAGASPGRAPVGTCPLAGGPPGPREGFSHRESFAGTCVSQPGSSQPVVCLRVRF